MSCIYTQYLYTMTEYPEDVVKITKLRNFIIHDTLQENLILFMCKTFIEMPLNSLFVLVAKQSKPKSCEIDDESFDHFLFAILPIIQNMEKNTLIENFIPILEKKSMLELWRCNFLKKFLKYQNI